MSARVSAINDMIKRKPRCTKHRGCYTTNTNCYILNTNAISCLLYKGLAFYIIIYQLGFIAHNPYCFYSFPVLHVYNVNRPCTFGFNFFYA